MSRISHLYEGLVEVLHFCIDLLLLPNAVGHLGMISSAIQFFEPIWVLA